MQQIFHRIHRIEVWKVWRRAIFPLRRFKLILSTIDFLGFDQSDGKVNPIMDTSPRNPLSLVFRAFVFLSNLLHGLPLIQTVAIVSDRGAIKGYLKIAMQQICTSSTVSPTGETTDEQIKLMRTYRNACGLIKLVFDDETYFQVMQTKNNEPLVFLGMLFTL